MNDNTIKKEGNHILENCENICRICMSFTNLLLPIFEGEGVEQDLEMKIQKYLPVKISLSDSLPQQLCFHCADALICWDSLITICLESDKKLRYLLKMPSSSGENNMLDNSKGEAIKIENFTDGTRTNNSALEDLSNERESLKLKKYSPKRLKRKLPPNESKFKMHKMEELTSEDVVPEIKTEASELGNDSALNCSGEVDRERRGGGGESSSLTCEFCGKLYKGKRYLARHIKLSHKQQKSMEAQKCDLCQNVYKTKANLERHYSKEHVNNQVECPVCHVSVHSRKLESHLKSVHGVKTEIEKEEKFKCKFCDKWFKNKYVRNAHVKEIHLSEPVKCKLCDFRGIRTVLRRHRTEVHVEKRFPCSLCNNAFKTLHTLKMHMTSHSDLRSFTCDICGMGFKRLNNVRDHMKCHEQKSNQCQICGNFFARKRYLAIHEKTIHNFYADGVIPEEKGFECGICGAKLKWKKNLLAHMRIHTGEKPYVCKICKKDFVCHGSLRTHMIKHGVCAAKENNALSFAAQEEPQDPSQPMGIAIFNQFSIQ